MGPRPLPRLSPPGKDPPRPLPSNLRRPRPKRPRLRSRPAPPRPRPDLASWRWRRVGARPRLALYWCSLLWGLGILLAPNTLKPQGSQDPSPLLSIPVLCPLTLG